jgi:hypothetical protein
MPFSLIKFLIGQISPINRKILRVNVSNSLVTHVEKLAAWPKIVDRNSSNFPKRKPTESTRKAEVVMKVYVEHDKRWCLDSGASSHMCSEKAKFKETKTPKVQTLNLANSYSTKIVGSGTVRPSVEENITVRPTKLCTFLTYDRISCQSRR